MTRILINNMGSQASDIINLLHQKKMYVIYLSAGENEKIKSVADEFYLEKKFPDIKDYADHLIKICIEKNIDLFIPQRKMEELSEYKTDFENEGIKVLLPDDIELFKNLNNKVKTYEIFKDIIPEIVPKYYLVTNKSEFITACNSLKESGKIPCMKYVTDIASNSFRIINMKPHTFKELDKKTEKEKSIISHSEDFRAVLEMFENENLPKDMIVMEYIPNEEISCDCLKTSKGNIIIPRIKISKTEQKIYHNEKIIELCNKILNNIDYDTPCNIQFKLDKENKPILLEINTRMSGGIMYSSWASNINIPVISILQKLQLPYDFEDNWKDVKLIQKTELI